MLRQSHRCRFLLAACAVMGSPAFAAPVVTSEPGGHTLALWPHGAPGGEHVTVREEIIERSPDGPMRDRFAQHVRKPLLTLFAPKTPWNGITMLVVPGGGYVRVVIDKEGFEAAEWFAARGFATAVLRYRLPADGWAAGADAPVHDALRAIRMLRRHDFAGGVPKRIGILGFSAGGHLTARLITEPTLAYPRQDATDELSGRPDFAVLMYPVIATSGPAAHAGSANQLRLAGVSADALPRYSPHLNVTAATPPTLIVHASDDATVPVENSLMMYRALRDAGVRGELHVFDSGGHGFGLRGVAGRSAAAWPSLVRSWAELDGGAK